MAKVVTRKCIEVGCGERVRVKSNLKRLRDMEEGGVEVVYIFARCRGHDLDYREIIAEGKDGSIGHNKRRERANSGLRSGGSKRKPKGGSDKYFKGKRGKS